MAGAFQNLMSAHRALFLDRDGVINRDDGYVYQSEKFMFQDQIFDIARQAIDNGYLIVVITNQSGIGRGYYDEADFLKLTDWMKARFKAEIAPISAVYYCPYHAEATVERYRAENHPWRKPNPGMLRVAGQELGIDLSRSIMIGDRGSDMKAAQNAGLCAGVLLGEHSAFEIDGDMKLYRFQSLIELSSSWPDVLLHHDGKAV